jgi:hypothetical protein
MPGSMHPCAAAPPKVGTPNICPCLPPRPPPSRRQLQRPQLAGEEGALLRGVLAAEQQWAAEADLEAGTLKPQQAAAGAATPHRPRWPPWLLRAGGAKQANGGSGGSGSGGSGSGGGGQRWRWGARRQRPEECSELAPAPLHSSCAPDEADWLDDTPEEEGEAAAVSAEEVRAELPLASWPRTRSVEEVRVAGAGPPAPQAAGGNTGARPGPAGPAGEQQQPCFHQPPYRAGSPAGAGGSSGAAGCAPSPPPQWAPHAPPMSRRSPRMPGGGPHHSSGGPSPREHAAGGGAGEPCRLGRSSAGTSPAASGRGSPAPSEEAPQPQQPPTPRASKSVVKLYVPPPLAAADHSGALAQAKLQAAAPGAFAAPTGARAPVQLGLAASAGSPRAQQACIEEHQEGEGLRGGEALW